MTILSFIFTISILVFVHEYGHYYSARLCGVHVEEFSIGFGTELFVFVDKNKTRWKICLIPLGGFVRMQNKPKDSKDDGYNCKAYNTQPILNRMLIVLSGPLANFIFAAVILIFYYNVYGKYIVSSLPAVGQIVINSPAEKYGIVEDDLIIQVAEVKISNFLDLQKVISSYPGKPVDIIIKRAEKLVKINVVPEAKIYRKGEKEILIGYLGIRPVYIHTKLNIIGSMLESYQYIIGLSKLILQELGQVFVKAGSIQELKGIITIAKYSKESMEKGTVIFMLFMVNMSINLGLINLLPIPILDGGQFIYLVYEAIAGKELSSTMYNITMRIGLIFIIFLIVISTSNDIKSLVLSKF